MNKEGYQYYKVFSDKLQDFCCPLQDILNIPHFGYIKLLFQDNRYFYFSNNDLVSKDYLEQVNSSNIFFSEYIRYYGENRGAILWPQKPDIANTSMQVYYNHKLWHGITFFKLEEDKLELWWFANELEREDSNYFYIRNLDILEKFILDFQSKTSKIFLDDKEHCFASYKDFNIFLPNI